MTIMSAQQKEDRLFENIYLSYFPKMKRFAQEYVISEQDAENIVQDMFAELWEKREMFTCQTIRIAYLFTIIKNKCLNHLRAQAVRLRAHGEMEELQQRVLRESIRSLEMCDPERLFEGEVERIVRDSLERADILKLNEDELPVVARFFGLEGAAERVVAQLVERFSLRYVVFTEGGRGSRVTAADGRTSYLATPRVEVADTVGAGDAFTATFAASLMQGLPMEECHRRAVAVAAFVCTRHGAIAPLSEFMKTEITNR